VRRILDADESREFIASLARFSRRIALIGALKQPVRSSP